MKTTRFVNTSVMLCSTALFFSCGIRVQKGTEDIQQTQTSDSLGQLKVDVNKYASNKLVCDPLNPEVSIPSTYEHGIKATLHYLDTGMPRMYKATDYIQFGRKSDKDVFLADMNVPTRMFTEGFATHTKEILTKDNGERLIEFFGLKMNTNIMLTDDDEEGDYELAMLADDGSNLTLKKMGDNGVDDLLISNDGDHPTRMGCSTHTVNFKRNEMKAIEATYYQGPRYHISNVLLWRKSTTAGTDSLCGQLGNHLFFNPDDHSKPMQAFKDLEARGWRVLRPGNFVLNKTDYNPCVPGTAPVITNFNRNEVGSSTVFLTWQTDIPATAQVQLTNMTTGVVTTTTSDNQLRTTHEVFVQGLQRGTTYKAQAIAVSEDLGRSLSSEIIFTTQQ